MNAGRFVKEFPIVASQMREGETQLVWVAGEAIEATRTGPGPYAFTFKRLPAYDKAPQAHV